jgi:flagellar assembly protein FliH
MATFETDRALPRAGAPPARSHGFVPLAEPAAVPASRFVPLAAAEQAPAAPAAEEAPAAADDETRRAFQAGYELGREELRGQIESIGESFVKSLEELSEFRARLRDRYERELLEVALGVARKVVRQELAARPEIWLGMIRAAVRHAVDREHLVLRVPAALAGYLRDAAPELRVMLEDVKEIEVVEDTSLPPGGCVIESRFGEVDIGVETQLEAAERALVQSEA